MTGRSFTAEETNKLTDYIRVRIYNHFHKVEDWDNVVMVEKIKKRLLSLEYRHETQMKDSEQINSYFDKLA